MSEPERTPRPIPRTPILTASARRSARFARVLVTNGLGGYASGTLWGVMTRRFHGSSWPRCRAEGRMMMLNHLSDRVRLPTVASWG